MARLPDGWRNLSGPRVVGPKKVTQDMVSRICGISSVEGSEGSSGRERYVVATASGPGLRADASSHQLAGRLPPYYSRTGY